MRWEAASLSLPVLGHLLDWVVFEIVVTQHRVDEIPGIAALLHETLGTLALVKRTESPLALPASSLRASDSTP